MSVVILDNQLNDRASLAKILVEKLYREELYPFDEVETYTESRETGMKVSVIARFGKG